MRRGSWACSAAPRREPYNSNSFVAHDDELKASLARTLATLRSQLDGNFRAAAEEVVRTMTAERARAVAEATAEVRRQAQQQLAQMRDAATKQHDETIASAEAQIGELGRMLDDLRLSAQQQLETARKTLDTEVASVRARAATEIEDTRRVTRLQVEDAQRAANERVSRLQGELDASRDELIAVRRQLEDAQQEARDARAQAEQARLAALTGPPRREDPLGDVVDATRSIDGAATLVEVFEQVLAFAALISDSSLLLIVEGERLRGWRGIGFDAVETIDIPKGGYPAAQLAHGKDRDAAVFPLTVSGIVVAVLYADVAPARGGVYWRASLEVVTRHASRVLETTTVQRTGDLLATRSMARTSQSGAWPGRTQQ
jgi:hypothetical protein